jgi:bacterioferritin-associated ferredoxin
MYICMCHGITERQVRDAIAQGAVDLSDLQAELGIATSCGGCAETALGYLPGGRYASDTVDAAQSAINTAAQMTVLTSTEIRRVA